MQTTILLVALVVFSFAISRVLTRVASRYFVVSGTEHILVGLLLGPVFAVLDPETLAKFDLLIALLLGLVGFFLGLRTREALRSVRAAIAGVVGAGVVLAAVTAASLVLLEALDESGATRQVWSIPWGDRVAYFAADLDNLRLAATLGCCAAVTSPVLIAESARVLRAKGPALDLMRATGLVSQIVALGVFGIVLASARASATADELRIPVAWWAVGIAVFGAVTGLLFTRFVGHDRNDTRIYISAVGVVTFASGIGEGLGVSPLVVNLIAGMFVSLTSPDTAALERTLVRLRHPILVLVRVFAGATWKPVALLYWLLVPVYTLGRLLCRRLTAYNLARLLIRETPPLPRIGYGLVAQGGLAGAIALSYAVRVPEHAGVVLTTVLGGVILSDLLSHRAVRRVLADAGEVGAVDAETASSNADQAVGDDVPGASMSSMSTSRVLAEEEAE